jgi:DNA-binding NarL/FixJ family response regulator
MRVAVVCRDALLRDGILSLLAHEGAFDVAAGGEHVTGITRAFNDDAPAVLVAVADSLDTDDWVQLNQIKASGNVHIILLVSSATSTVGQKVADAVVRRSEGSAALIQVVRRFIGPVMYKPYSPQPQQQHQQPQHQHQSISAMSEPVSIYGAPRTLTKRELEVAQLVAQGMPNRRIAAVLQLQEQSIKNLVSAVMRKLDCENRVQVALRLSGRPSVSARQSY